MILGILLFIIGAAISCAATDCDPRVLVGTILVAAGTVIFVLEDHPTAMDVYQGKTAIEFTYKDGIPVDSVVVFKYKEK